MGGKKGEQKEVKKPKQQTPSDEDSFVRPLEQDSFVREEDVLEDEYGVFDDEENNTDFLRVMHLLHSKDPKIYDKKSTFFKDITDEDIARAQEKLEKGETPKPLLIKDVIRQNVMKKMDEENPEYSDSDEEDISAPLPYAKEQERLKRELLSALDDDEDEEDIFTVKKKSKDQLEKEEKEFKEFQKKEGHKYKENKFEESTFMRQLFQKEAENEADKFLREYLVKETWKEPATEENTSEFIQEIPGGDDEDEDEVDRQEQFEHKYNFRYEQPGGTELTLFDARHTEDSARRKNETRKEKRERKKQNKALEMVRLEEETKRLKHKQKTEIKSKVEKIKQIANGSSTILKQIQEIAGADLDLKGLDLEGDFDPDAYDKQMAAIFNNEYYDQAENSKPFGEDDEDLGVSVDDEGDDNDGEDNEKGDGDSDDESEEDSSASSSDSSASSSDSSASSSDSDTSSSDSKEDKKSKKTKKGEKEKKIDKTKKEKENKNKKEEEEEEETIEDAISAEMKKQLLEQTKKELKEEIQKYHNLDFEDVIGKTPTRFKYTTVSKSTLGLPLADIIELPDSVLNKRASLRKLAPYRQTGAYNDKSWLGAGRFRKPIFEERERNTDNNNKTDHKTYHKTNNKPNNKPTDKPDKTTASNKKPSTNSQQANNKTKTTTTKPATTNNTNTNNKKFDSNFNKEEGKKRKLENNTNSVNPKHKKFTDE